MFYYSVSEQFCIRICLKASRYTLSKPSTALATLFPVFCVSCKMENCKLQNRNIQSIQDSDRQGERNPKVFIKAKVIQTSTLRSSDRDKNFKLPVQLLPDPNLGLEHTGNRLQLWIFCVGGNHSIFHFPTCTSLGFQCGKSTPDLNHSHPSESGNPRSL